MKPLVLRFIVIITAGLLAILTIRQCSFEKEPQSPQQTPPLKPTQQPKIQDVENKKIEDVVFQEKFFFGTASSDFQTTGGNGLTDWNKYIGVLEPPLIGPGIGTDFLNRYREDFDLAERFGNQVHRLSLEWARIEPEEGKFDKQATEKYLEIFQYMKSKNIEPMVCLNHFALPDWFVAQNGWESVQAPFYYSRYAEYVAREIGVPLKVKWWLTFNEPQVTISQGYAKGQWPPGKGIKNLRDEEGFSRLLLTSSRIIDAHRLSYRAIHKVMDKKIEKVMVSFASAPGLFYPYDESSVLDQAATILYDSIYTRLLDYSFGTADRDFIGLNYYGRSKLQFHISLGAQVLPWLNEETPFSIQWYAPKEMAQNNRPKEFYPQGLCDLIMKFKDLGLPIVITENGLNDDSDTFREEFIVIHLKAVHDAMRNGANIIGYQYWALTDTWEWDGVFSQMGLIKINREKNFERILRPSALIYGEIIRTRKIKKELLEKHKELLSQ